MTTAAAGLADDLSRLPDDVDPIPMTFDCH